MCFHNYFTMHEFKHGQQTDSRKTHNNYYIYPIITQFIYLFFQINNFFTIFDY